MVSRLYQSLVRALALEFDHIDRARVSLGLEESVEAPLQTLEGMSICSRRFSTCSSLPSDCSASQLPRFFLGLNIESGLFTLCYETSNPNNGASSPFPRIRVL